MGKGDAKRPAPSRRRAMLQVGRRRAKAARCPPAPPAGRGPRSARRPPKCTAPHSSSARPSRSASASTIVIAQHEIDAIAGGQPAERVGDPVDAARPVDQVAGQHHQVRLQLVAEADDFLEIGLADAAVEVEVGEVDQRQAVPGGRQPRDFDARSVRSRCRLWLPGRRTRK